MTGGAAGQPRAAGQAWSAGQIWDSGQPWESGQPQAAAEAPESGQPRSAGQPRAPRWPQRSITVRLWSGLAVFALPLVAAAAFIYHGVSHQDRSVDSLVQRLHPLDIANLESRAAFAQAQSVLRAYLLTRDPRFLRFYDVDAVAVSRALGRARDFAAATELTGLGAEKRAAVAWLGYAAQMQSLHQGDPDLARLTDAASAAAQRFYQASNRMQAQLQAESRAAVSSGRAAAADAVAAASVLAAVAVLLGLAVALAVVPGIARPLNGLVATLRQRAAADSAARAAETGPAGEAALPPNAPAGESHQPGTTDLHTARLGDTARDIGLRILEHQRAEDLLRAAKDALESRFGADFAYLHLNHGGVLGLPVGHEHDWLFPGGYLTVLRGQADTLFRDLFRRNATQVYQDIPGSDGDRLPPQVRDPLRAAGVVAQVIVPFGAGPEMLGIIMALRTSPGRPWTGAEVSAIESVAADLGHGLHHARLQEAENRLAGELRAVDQVKSDFLATVSHELRTPLTSIAGYIEMLRDHAAGPLTLAQDRMLDSVDRNTARLRHLIEDVLTLSKIESGAFTSMMRPVSLTEIVATEVEALQPIAAAKNLILTWQESGHSLVVNGDQGQLDRLVANVLSNAVKFTPAGGSISVSTGCDGDLAVVRVSDTGIGIPEGERKELFTRFFRASNAIGESIPGTGLGLAIARTIVASHHGDLQVTSLEGKGTTVTVRIPLLGDQGGRRPVPDVPVPDVPVRGGSRPA